MASSVICVRDAADAPEVLVVERSAASRFLPGYVAFPGGAVEAADEHNARRWFDAEAHAQRATAVRELVEEVGIALTSTGAVASGNLAAVQADPPSAAQLHEMAHWVA